MSWDSILHMSQFWKFLGNREACVRVNAAGYWNDVQCSKSLPRICAKPAKYSFCAIEKVKRDKCGEEKINESECSENNCCWDPDERSCFLPKNSIECLGQNGVCLKNGRDENSCSGKIDKMLCSNESQFCCVSQSTTTTTTTTTTTSTTTETNYETTSSGSNYSICSFFGIFFIFLSI